MFTSIQPQESIDNDLHNVASLFKNYLGLEAISYEYISKKMLSKIIIPILKKYSLSKTIQKYYSNLIMNLFSTYYSMFIVV